MDCATCPGWTSWLDGLFESPHNVCWRDECSAVHPLSVHRLRLIRHRRPQPRIAVRAGFGVGDSGRPPTIRLSPAQWSHRDENGRERAVDPSRPAVHFELSCLGAWCIAVPEGGGGGVGGIRNMQPAA